MLEGHISDDKRIGKWGAGATACSMCRVCSEGQLNWIAPFANARSMCERNLHTWSIETLFAWLLIFKSKYHWGSFVLQARNGLARSWGSAVC